jgi:hypothetical protein
MNIRDAPSSHVPNYCIVYSQKHLFNLLLELYTVSSAVYALRRPYFVYHLKPCGICQYWSMVIKLDNSGMTFPIIGKCVLGLLSCHG